MNTKVTLRKKKITNNRFSLYLDFYPQIYNYKTGKYTRREFLNLYISAKPKSQEEKTLNAEIMLAAEKVKTERQLQLIYENYDLPNKNEAPKDFLEYFRKKVITGYPTYKQAFQQFKTFCKGHCTTKDITLKFCDDFKKYLLTATKMRNKTEIINPNTAYLYFKVFRQMIKSAEREDLIRQSISNKLTNMKKKETEMPYLIEEEIKKLYHTPCSNVLVKRAAFFSIYTGLRVSDILKLQWSDIRKFDNETYLMQMVSVKEKNILYNPLPIEAMFLLGNKKDGKCFDGLTYNIIRNTLPTWIKDANIKRHITFHAFRHTFATRMLNKGSDIQTISKLLGHKSVATTEVYAKVMNQHLIELVKNTKILDFEINYANFYE